MNAPCQCNCMQYFFVLKLKLLNYKYAAETVSIEQRNEIPNFNNLNKVAVLVLILFGDNLLKQSQNLADCNNLKENKNKFKKTSWIIY